MALTMNEESMHHELNTLLDEGELYKACTWASILTSTPKLHTYAKQQSKRAKIGSSNIYCYIGLTSTRFNIITLNSLDVTRVTGRFSIPLEEIHHVTMKNGVLKCVATFDFGNENIKVLWVNQAAGTNITKQRMNVTILCDYFRTLYGINC